MNRLEGEARKLVAEGKNFAALGTIMPDGSTHTSLVWVDVEGDLVIFNTEVNRIKAKNMRRDPRVSMAVWNSENPYQQVMIRGRVVEMTTEGADAVINRLTKKYLGIDTFPYNRPGDQRVTVKMRPENVAFLK